MNRASSLTALLAALSLVAAAAPAAAEPNKRPLRAALSAGKGQAAARRIAAKADPNSCAGLATSSRGRPPFSVGEELAYDLSVSGLYLGRLETKVGRPQVQNGRTMMTLFGRARTNGFTSTLKPFLGRYMVLLDPESFRPVVLRAEATYGEEPRTELARFSEGFTELAASYKQGKQDGERSYDRAAPLFDVLTLLYQARRISLDGGARHCQEVYADKRLWRVDAEVVGLESVMTPAGKKDATLVKTVWVRMPHPDFDPKRPVPRVEVDVYFSRDGQQIPLAFVARAKEATARGDLVRWSTRDGEGDLSWEF